MMKKPTSNYVSPTGFGRPPGPRPRTPGLVFQPRVQKSLQRGINQLVNALKPTLGPLPRTVCINRALRTDAPEILDDGATIARRLIMLADRTEDVGAMLLRQALWRLHEDLGDGTATAAVLFQSIYNQGVAYLARGDGNAMRLRHWLECSLSSAVMALRRQARPIEGREAISHMARGLVKGDEELAVILGEIFDIAGPYGTIQVEERNRPGLDREYVEGMFFPSSGWCSAYLQTDSIYRRAVLDDTAVVISDVAVRDVQQIIPLMEMAAAAKIRHLALIVLNLCDEAVGLFVRNRDSQAMHVIAVRAPFSSALERAQALEDIAVLTGGRPILGAAGDSLESVRLEYLGCARRVWATDDKMGIVGGRGDPQRLRVHIQQLRRRAKTVDGDDRNQVVQRLGRLMGGAAFLYAGAPTKAEAEFRVGAAKRAVRSLRAALEHGVLPGGGAAYLACRPALALHRVAYEDEQAAAARILSRALEAPLRTLSANAGFVADNVVDRLNDYPAGWGLDVVTGQYRDMAAALIHDPLTVIERALVVAVSTAALALTTDVVVHRRLPPESVQP